MLGKSWIGMRIGTHDQTFKCSQVLACALLKLLPQYEDASIVRSQNQDVLDTCDIVVDVGGVYDPSRHRYDHRIRDFQQSAHFIIKEQLDYDWILKLTAAGLIYLHFGREILRNILSDVTEDRELIGEIFKMIYVRLITEIDARDYDRQIYSSSCTDLTARVYKLNWVYSPWHTEYEKEKQFEKAVALAQKEFLEIIQNVKTFDLPRIDVLRRAVGNRFEVDSSGEIIILSASERHEDLLFYVEKDMSVSLSIKYIILGPIESRNQCYWKIACILAPLESYMYRMLLPQAWGGLESDALVEACGVEGAVRVDPDRRIGIHETKDGAIAMARQALKIGKTVKVMESPYAFSDLSYVKYL